MKKLALLLAAAAAALALTAMLWASFRGQMEALMDARSMNAALVLAALSLVLHLAREGLQCRASPWPIGMLFLHAGLLAGLVSIGLDRVWGKQGQAYVPEGRSTSSYFDAQGQTHPLGFTLDCSNFTVELYPQGARARAYQADLQLSQSGQTEALTLSVNSPVVRHGYRLVLQGSGLEDTGLSYIDLSIRAEGTDQRFKAALDESLKLADGREVRILDFSPTLGQREGRYFTADPEVMKNPAYRVEVRTPKGQIEQGWVLKQNPQTHELGGLTFDFRDFYGIEYAVISVSREPFAGMAYLGCVLVSLGVGIVLLLGRRREL